MLIQPNQTLIEGHMLISGSWQPAECGRTLWVFNLANQSLVGIVSDARPEDALEGEVIYG